MPSCHACNSCRSRDSASSGSSPASSTSPCLPTSRVVSGPPVTCSARCRSQCRSTRSPRTSRPWTSSLLSMTTRPRPPLPSLRTPASQSAICSGWPSMTAVRRSSSAAGASSGQRASACR
ncbi:MAG: hypothetical protein AW07_04777 [Candidatus Accumulibacter sp. SK-11]|nr:MAG: hypothetical protein AW07_04777 [Candidatus Accumulibacter sp. SK-11]